MQPLLILSTMAVLLSCASSKPEPSRAPVIPTQVGFEIEKGSLERNAEPLPDKRNIHATWHYTDGATKRVLAYRGWDFNKDGRIDMLEVLSLDGKPEAMAFDFDGDGKIDMLKKREKNEFDISRAVNMPEAPTTSIIAH